jgi:hypothetical protein
MAHWESSSGAATSANAPRRPNQVRTLTIGDGRRPSLLRYLPGPVGAGATQFASGNLWDQFRLIAHRVIMTAPVRAGVPPHMTLPHDIAVVCGVRAAACDSGLILHVLEGVVA